MKFEHRSITEVSAHRLGRMLAREPDGAELLHFLGGYVEEVHGPFLEQRMPVIQARLGAFSPETRMRIELLLDAIGQALTAERAP